MTTKKYLTGMMVMIVLSAIQIDSWAIQQGENVKREGGYISTPPCFGGGCPQETKREGERATSPTKSGSKPNIQIPNPSNTAGTTTKGAETASEKPKPPPPPPPCPGGDC